MFPGSPLGIAGDVVPTASQGIPGMPVLPPIGQSKLTTIGEASREHTQAFSLPMPQADGKFFFVAAFSDFIHNTLPALGDKKLAERYFCVFPRNILYFE